MRNTQPEFDQKVVLASVILLGVPTLVLAFINGVRAVNGWLRG